MARRLARAAATLVAATFSAGVGCASTEFFYEGPGQPSDRASGAVPAGSIGVCREPSSRRPPIVNADLWEHARPCTPRTPPTFVRLGYGKGKPSTDATVDDREAKILGLLTEGRRPEGGNAKMLALLRQLREESIRDVELRDRVSKATARTTACDYTYLLNTMERERDALAQGDACAARAYDPKVRGETCLFDTSVPEAVWLTSSWDCVTHTGATGAEQSCHRLCDYDDYCTMQVSCAASDIDLLLCVMGVCLPEQRAGF